MQGDGEDALLVRPPGVKSGRKSVVRYQETSERRQRTQFVAWARAHQSRTRTVCAVAAPSVHATAPRPSLFAGAWNGGSDAVQDRLMGDAAGTAASASAAAAAVYPSAAGYAGMAGAPTPLPPPPPPYHRNAGRVHLAEAFRAVVTPIMAYGGPFPELLRALWAACMLLRRALDAMLGFLDTTFGSHAPPPPPSAGGGGGNSGGYYQHSGHGMFR